MYCMIPMDAGHLQMFADGEPAGGGGGAEPGPGKETAGLPAFDEFLKGEGNQAEFDRRMQKAIDTAVKNAREKWQTLADERVSEAEKLAKMTAAEKLQYQEAKRAKELDAREAEITRRELMATAKNTLADRKLPQQLAGILDYTDADACNKSISAVAEAFQAAVEAAVQERLKGGDPMQKAPRDEGKELEKQIAAAIRGGMY